MDEKQILQEELTARGKTFDKRWGTAKLKEVLSPVVPTSTGLTPSVESVDPEEEELKVIEAIKNVGVLLSAETPTGPAVAAPIIPHSAITGMGTSKSTYSMLISLGHVFVHKTDSHNPGVQNFVREYDEVNHGPTYLQLAQMFVDKNNSR